MKTIFFSFFFPLKTEHEKKRKKLYLSKISLKNKKKREPTHTVRKITQGKKGFFFSFYAAEKADTESCFVRPGVKLMDLNKAGLFILRSAVAGVGWGSLSSILCSSNVGFTEKKQTEASFAISSIFFFFFTFRQSLFKKEVFPGLLSASFL